MVLRTMGNEIMVWEKAFKKTLFPLMLRVDDDLSFRMSILKMILLFREVFLMTEE